MRGGGMDIGTLDNGDGCEGKDDHVLRGWVRRTPSM